MALAELIFGKKVRAQIGVIQFDCSVTETHTEESDITEHPVEDGGTTSDHIVSLPSKLDLNGIVTNTPIVYLASQFAKSPNVEDTFGSADRVATAYDELLRIKKQGEIVTAITSLREYSNMAIKTLVVVRDAANGKVLNATISLREVPTVKTQSASIPVPADVGNNDDTNKGRKGKETPSDKTEQNISALQERIVKPLKALFRG